MLVLEGAYLVSTEPPAFRRIAPPREAVLQALVERLAERIGRALERQGVLVRETDSSFLAFDPATGGPMADLIGHSITYRGVAACGAESVHAAEGATAWRSTRGSRSARRHADRHRHPRRPRVSRGAVRVDGGLPLDDESERLPTDCVRADRGVAAAARGSDDRAPLSARRASRAERGHREIQQRPGAAPPDHSMPLRGGKRWGYASCCAVPREAK